MIIRWVFFISILISLPLSAQIQRGYVKTIGRPDKPGVAIENVLIRVNGEVNKMLSNAQGNFSFPVKGEKFRFSWVNKKGYELADRDLLNQDFPYTYSSPVTIAMISRFELQHERDLIEEQARAKLDEQFKIQNAILEAKLEKMQITNEEFGKRVSELEKKYNNLDSLVNILSDIYARTDYDVIDKERLEINKCIENGELERAQQLILSKGNLDLRIQKLEETKRLRQQMQESEKNQEKDLLSDLHQLCEIARTENRFDLAYTYLEKIYFMDTTNVLSLWKLASTSLTLDFFPTSDKQEVLNKHLGYLNKLLTSFQSPDIAIEFGTTVPLATANVEDMIGRFYFYKMHENEMAMLHYQREVEVIRNAKLGLLYRPLYNMGLIFLRQHDFKKAIESFQNVIEIGKKQKAAELYKLWSHEEIANIYYLMDNFEMGLKEYIKIEKLRIDRGNNDNRKIKDQFELQGYIGRQFYMVGEYKKAIYYYKRSISNAELYYSLTKENESIKAIVRLLHDLQNVYENQGNHDKSLLCAEKALEYASLYMARRPSSLSKLFYAETLIQIAKAHLCLGRMDLVIPELVECLKKSEYACNVYAYRYNILLYETYCTFANLYEKRNKPEQALYALQKAISTSPYKFRMTQIMNKIGDMQPACEISEMISKIKKETFYDEKITLTDYIYGYLYKY